MKKINLFDPDATDSFIYVYALDKCGLTTYKHDDFRLVNMVLGEKQLVGSHVEECFLYLGVCTTRLKVYITSLGTYDIIIGMDWLETNQDFLVYLPQRVLCFDDEGGTITIHDIKK